MSVPSFGDGGYQALHAGPLREPGAGARDGDRDMTTPGPAPAGQVHFGPAPYDPGVSGDPEAAAEAEAEWADECGPHAVGNTYAGGIESDPDLALGDEDWWAAMAEAYTYGRFGPSPGSREAEAFARFDAAPVPTPGG